MGYTVHFYVRPGDGWDEAFRRFGEIAPAVVSAAGGDVARLDVSDAVVSYASLDGEPFRLDRDVAGRGLLIPELNGDWSQQFAKTSDSVVPALLVAAKSVFGGQVFPLTDHDAGMGQWDPVWAWAVEVCAAAGVDVEGVVVGEFPPDLPDLPDLSDLPDFP